LVTDIRLLLIDDDPDDRALTQLILKSEFGHIETREVSDALSFAHACARSDFDLVVLEQRLGWAEGLAVLKLLKQEWPDRPVIVLTRHGSEEVSAAAARLRADHYLTKRPGDLVRLPQAVADALLWRGLPAGVLQKAAENGKVHPDSRGGESLREPEVAGASRRERGPAPSVTSATSATSATSPAREEDPRQFALMAAHELQKPVRQVERYTQVMREEYRGRLDEGANQLLDRIGDAAHRLQAVVDSLLSLARVDSRERHFEPVDMEELLDQALLDLREEIQACGAEVSRSPMPPIQADPVQIGQLLENLIGNALRFRGEEPPRIVVSAARSGSDWVFSVHDNGVGIDPDELERIFTPFQRLRPDVPGTGLGLAICRRIAERHGGRIWARSEIGQGTTLFFTFPAER
jgi:signal transduction histidine kinase